MGFKAVCPSAPPITFWDIKFSGVFQAIKILTFLAMPTNILVFSQRGNTSSSRTAIRTAANRKYYQRKRKSGRLMIVEYGLRPWNLKKVYVRKISERNDCLSSGIIIIIIIYIITDWLTYLLTHSLTYLLTYWLTYLLTYLLTYWLTYLLTYFLTHSLTHSFA